MTTAVARSAAAKVARRGRGERVWVTGDEIRAAVGAGLVVVTFDDERPGSNARLELTRRGSPR